MSTKIIIIVIKVFYAKPTHLEEVRFNKLSNYSLSSQTT